MAHPDTQQGDLREYVDVVRARKWTILFVFALVLGISLFRSYRQTPLYVSSTRLLVAGVPQDSTGVVGVPHLGTEAEVVQSVEVAQVAQRSLAGKQDPTALLGGLSVTPVSDTQVLTISYTSSDPQLAADAANAFAEGYITFKQEGARASLEPVIENTQAKKTELVTQLDRVEDRLQKAQDSGTPEEVARLDAQRTQIAADLDLVDQRLGVTLGTDVTIAFGGGDILQPAGVASEPSSPDHRTNGIIGGVFGILIGLAAGFMRDRLDNRFRSRVDAERTLTVPVLATVPKFKAPKKASTVLLGDSRSSASESFRTLRTNLQFLAGQRQAKSITVTSASSGEGKSVTTANLAVAMAQAGQRVVVVSADLRRPSIDDYFSPTHQSPGLVGWLSGLTTDLDRLVAPTEIENIFLIPAGSIPQNPAELLTSPRLDDLIEKLESRFDMILFDSVPTLAIADAAIVASRTDAAILVIDSSATFRPAAMHSKDELERVGSTLLGVVLNRFEVAGSPYYYYNYKASKPDPISGNGSGNGAGPQTVATGRKGLFGRRR